ncbi:hypothetical protein DS906_00610 [Ruegeria sp. A3M17]|nr:hypothetical protein DS906_00610 [Ruegeria sp. A3M17]
MSGLIWVFYGHAGAEQAKTLEGRWGLMIFAFAGIFSTFFGRICLYRATELLGAVRASLLRRLPPVFAVLFAFVIFGSVPEWRDVLGGGIVLAGVLLYFGPLRKLSTATPLGYLVAIGFAAFYALAYCLRSLGLEDIPDPALGTFVGAMAGLAWLWLSGCFQNGLRKSPLRSLSMRVHWAFRMLRFAQSAAKFHCGPYFPSVGGAANVPYAAIYRSMKFRK